VNDALEKSYRRHTLRVMLMVFMVGSGMLFLSISAFSIFYINHSHFSLSAYPFPKAFVISTVVILISGLFIYKVRENFENGHLKSVFRYLLLTLAGSLAFIGFQFLGGIKPWIM